MNSFEEFRKKVDMSCEELEEVTGYTRQGLDNAFKNLSKGKVNKKFLNMLLKAIQNEENYEQMMHEARMNNLRKLKNDVEFRMGNKCKVLLLSKNDN